MNNSASEVARMSLRKLDEEDRWKLYVQTKVTKGLADLAAGRTISGEEFLAEINARRRKRLPR